MKREKTLIEQKKQLKRILVAPYRKGINYLKIIDKIRAIADEQYKQSLDKVFERI